MRTPAKVLAATLLMGSAAALAAIPSATKVADAVAETNRADGRGQALLLDVNLTIGDAAGPSASGVLATHPTGLARLELRNHQGFVERHLLQGDAHTASRQGQLLSDPHPFLPPVYLLQATSGAALNAALGSFGVVMGTAALGRVEDHDCYVLGGRFPRDTDGAERRLPSLWVDVESYEVLRVDRADGVRFRFGPGEVYEGIRVPRWIAIEAPGRPVARLDIVRAAPANAPAAAFGTDWLLAPPAP